MSKPVFIALGSDNSILATFLAASPALSYAAAHLGGDTNKTLTVEHADRSYHDLSPRLFKALASGMTQGQTRRFKVMLAQDSDELVAARTALRKAQDAIQALPSELPEEIVHNMLQPLQDAVTALEDADSDDAAHVTILASQPLRRAYGTVEADADAEEPAEEPASAPESASDRAAQFKASIGLK